MDIQAKGEAFAALHVPGKPFIIPNPWDIGTALLSAHAGFKALATTSAGFAFSLGKLDYQLSRDQVLDHCREMAGATDLPVAADLESGFGDTPEDVAETYRLAGETGLVGASIEDSQADAANPIRDIGEATERVAAAVESARALPFRFTLTARAENHLHGRNDLDDTIRRLQAYEAAGADVLYAPGLGSHDDIKRVCDAIGKPINVLAGFADPPLTRDQLADAGVARISLGSHLTRAAFAGLNRALTEMASDGTFGFIAGNAPYPDLKAAFGEG